MARHIIAIEGLPSVLPDVWLTPGSLYMADERVPVIDRFNWDQDPIGWARDLQRNNHEVSVDIELFSGEKIDEKLFDASFWANELVEELAPATDEVAARRFILKAQVKGIAIVPKAAYPASH